MADTVPNAESLSDVRRTLIASIFVALAAVLPYLNTLNADFTFDDYGLVIDNPVLPSSATPRAILLRPSCTGGLYRPVTMLTYAVNRYTGGDRFAFHLTNVLLHALASAVVLFLALELLQSPFGALVAGVVFAVHPIHTEAVASLAGRAEILAAAFVGVALLFSVYADQTHGSPVSALGTISLVAFSLALLSKESAVTAIPLMMLILYWRGSRVGRILRRAVPYIVVCAFYLVARLAIVGSVTLPEKPQFLDNPLAYASVFERLGTALVIIWSYVSTLIMPLRLSADESFDQIPVVHSISDGRFIIALLMLVATGATLVVNRKRLAPVTWGALFAAAAMSVTANVLIPIGTIKAERLLYLPSVGFCVAAGWLAQRYKRSSESWHAVPRSLGIVVLIALAYRTWARNADWYNNFNLFTSTVEASPNSARAHQNAAAVYGQAGDLDHAIVHYKQALAIYPHFRSAAEGLALAYRMKGQEDEAARWQNAARKIDGNLQPLAVRAR
jgi:uncharacterized membrane protein